MNTGFQHQQPLHNSAAVRSAPSPQHGAHMEMQGPGLRPSDKAPLVAVEEKSFGPPVKR